MDHQLRFHAGKSYWLFYAWYGLCSLCMLTAVMATGGDPMAKEYPFYKTHQKLNGDIRGSLFA